MIILVPLKVGVPAVPAPEVTVAVPLVTVRSKVKTIVCVPDPSPRGSTVRPFNDRGRLNVPAPLCVLRALAELSSGGTRSAKQTVASFKVGVLAVLLVLRSALYFK